MLCDISTISIAMLFHVRSRSLCRQEMSLLIGCVTTQIQQFANWRRVGQLFVNCSPSLVTVQKSLRKLTSPSLLLISKVANGTEKNYGGKNSQKFASHLPRAFSCTWMPETGHETERAFIYRPPLYNGYFFWQTVHACTLVSTSLQWPLSSVPKVAVVKRFNCRWRWSGEVVRHCFFLKYSGKSYKREVYSWRGATERTQRKERDRRRVDS